MGRHGFPGIFPAKVWHAAAFSEMVLREASALMRISSNYNYYDVTLIIIIPHAPFRYPQDASVSIGLVLFL